MASLLTSFFEYLLLYYVNLVFPLGWWLCNVHRDCSLARPGLASVVIGAGILYGMGEDDLHFLFKVRRCSLRHRPELHTSTSSQALPVFPAPTN